MKNLFNQKTISTDDMVAFTLAITGLIMATVIAPAIRHSADNLLNDMFISFGQWLNAFTII